MKYRTANRVSKEEAAWAAGFIDGEGTITLSRRRKGVNRHIAISITSTEICLLKYPQKLFGVGFISKKRIVKKEHSPSFSYHIANQQALDVLEQITPYLRGYKKKRADLVLKKYKNLTPRNGKYTPELTKKREKFVEDFFRILPNKTPH